MVLLDGVNHIALISNDVERLGAMTTIRHRLITAGAGDGHVNEFGATRSTFFRDPDGLEGEVLVSA